MKKKNQMLKEKIKKFFSEKKHIADIILVSSIIVIGLTTLLIFNLVKKEGNSVEVWINDKVVATYPLSVNAEYELNGGTNILVIEDGKAYLRYSKCPDQTCVLGKSFYGNKISYVNQEICCLPNNVLIRVVGEVTDENGGVDF